MSRIQRLSFTLVAALVATLMSATQAAEPEVIVSKNDDRQYRYLQLDNKMQVLLVSDPTSEKAAAAMDVFVGSNQNPKDREGLAHFLEHMLFLGTKKYPAPGEYQEFISEHGGNHNAYTSSEHTNYHFSVDARHLDASLDRFAQFFVAPLFTEEYVDRERHAVESEYKLRIKNESRRRGDVDSELVNPQHPGALFRTGNLETLADRENDTVRDALLKFYKQFYSANIMSLAVLGSESLDELEGMVVERFGQVENNDVVIDEAIIPLYEEGFLPAKVEVVPLKEERRLTFSFPIPSSSDYYRKKPLHYIGNLLAHEGEGSLLSFLKRYGWAEGLSAGGGNITRFDGIFNINIQLTKRGVNAIDQIVALTFHVINNLERKGIEEWRFEEDKTLGDIAFRFQEKGPAMSTVTSLASRMHAYDAEDILRGGYIFTEFDPVLIREFLSYLRVDNVLLMLTAPDLATDKQSHWYQTPYKVSALKAEKPNVLDKYSRELFFPKENPFIPQRLSMKSASLLSDKNKVAKTVPEKIVDTENYDVWFKQDDQFQVPRADITLRLKLPMAAQSPKTAAMNTLFVALVNDSLNEFAYPANLAGLHFSVQSNSRGMDINIDGYNDRQGLLLTRIVETIRKARFDEARFNSVKAELLRSWNNANKASPYQQLAREVAAIEFSPMWRHDVLRSALSPVTFADFNGFSATLLTNAQAEALFYGNLYRQEAVKLSALVQNQLLHKDGDISLPRAQVVKLGGADGRGKSPLLRQLDVDHKDTAAVLYVQGLDDSLEDKAKMLLLRQVLHAPFFNSLRTEKQLGYVVMATGMPLKKVPGSILIVQSPVADGARLIEEIGGFVDSFTIKLPKDLDTFKQAVNNNLLQNSKNLSEKASRYWTNVLYRNTDFNRRELLAQAVNKISAEQLAEYYAAVNKPERRLWLLSTALDEEYLSGVEVIDDLSEFKREAVVYSYH